MAARRLAFGRAALRAGHWGRAYLDDAENGRGAPAEGGVALVNSTKIVPMLRALGFVRYAMASKSEMFFGLGADLDVQDTHFDKQTVAADGTTTTQTVFDPWMVRPTALFGISADVFAY
jgi:hypothetical protein